MRGPIIAPSALRHAGITEADVLSAYVAAFRIAEVQTAGENALVLQLGPDADGVRMLEVGHVFVEGRAVIVHCMVARKKYLT